MIKGKMNYYFTGILIILICLLTLIKPAHSGSTQTNTSGSNTAIEVDTHLLLQLHINPDQNLQPQLIILQTQT